MSSPSSIREFLLGSLGVLASLSVNEVAAVFVAAATVFALLPLGLTRWRDYLRDRKSGPPK